MTDEEYLDVSSLLTEEEKMALYGDDHARSDRHSMSKGWLGWTLDVGVDSDSKIHLFPDDVGYPRFCSSCANPLIAHPGEIMEVVCLGCERPPVACPCHGFCVAVRL